MAIESPPAGHPDASGAPELLLNDDEEHAEGDDCCGKGRAE
jgi:hypothetical protein